MTVIAMTREMGTLGKDVAMDLSVKLGLALVHHELVEESLAARMDIGASDVHRFLEGHESLLDRWKIDARRLSRYTAEEILAIAQKENVLIRGWGATLLLRGIPNVLRVRICAPMEFRINEMAERLGIDDRTVVRREIERNDAAHTRTIRRFFSTAWESPLNYHLVLNTGDLSVPQCVAQIETLAADPTFAETPESRTLLADEIIRTRVLSAFETSRHASLHDHAVDVAVQDGVVTLSGVTSVEADVSAAVETAKGVEGVVAVENRIANAGGGNVWA